MCSDAEENILSASREIAHIASHWCKRVYIDGEDIPRAENALPAEDMMSEQIAGILRRHFKNK